MRETALYIVPTPIGNLDDITLRALQVLQEVDTVLAEDTRKSGILLKHYNISKPLKSYHQFNEHKVLSSLISKLKAGEKLALITDAGTPAISDPGYLLVRECLKEEINVETLPGATAFVPALVNSGLPCDRFVFEGFLPQKKGRQSKMEALRLEPRTMVFFESPHRISKTLHQLAEVLGGDRKAAISRELTKIHEENIQGTLQSLAENYQDKKVKGEIVLVVAGNGN